MNRSRPEEMSPRRLACPLLATILLLALLLPGTGAAAAETAGGRFTLLVTHPSAGELRNLAGLVKRGYLKVPGLQVRGIYHASEWEDYQPSRSFVVEEGPDWMEIEELDCDLPRTRVYSRNDCSRVFEQLFAAADGIIFTGGPDIPPELYGEKTRLTTVIEDPQRHYFEISLLAHLLGSPRAPALKPLLARRPRFLVLGLCLGMQSMNVAGGGTLIQDIPSQLYGVQTLEAGKRLPADKVHRSLAAPLYPAPGVGWAVIHPIRIAAGWPAAAALLPGGKGGLVRVVSLHHQAVGRLGRDLQVWAASLDGKVIEGIHHRRWPAVLGVQFHPEKDIIYNHKRIYLASAEASVTNYVAAWFSADTRAQAFHRAFWKMIGAMLRASAESRTAGNGDS